jgi:hypothetical protein
VAQGRLPDGAAATVAFPISASPGRSNYLPNDVAGPWFNEILVRNDGVAPAPDGHWVSWIELVNPSATASLDLSGMRVRIEPDSSGDWIFPSGTTLGAGALLVLWCDPAKLASTDLAPPLQVGRALPLLGGKLTLIDVNDRVVDLVEYGSQISNMSFGRAASAGAGLRLLAAPTLSAQNTVAAEMGPVSALRINEWSAMPQSGDDWIELFNTSALPVDLSGCFLTDDASIAGKVGRTFKANSFIGRRGYAVVLADDAAVSFAGHLPFKLASEGDALRLYTATSELIDAADFGAGTPGVSSGRYPEGGAAIVQFTGTASPGATNYIDTDADRLPDAWEIANGLSTTLDDASLDNDGDGESNLSEFVAGTDPRDSQSVLRVQASREANGGLGTRISFTAQPDRTYTIEFSDSLTSPSWQKLSDVPAAATSRPVEITDPATDRGARFYRVVIPRVP